MIALFHVKQLAFAAQIGFVSFLWLLERNAVGANMVCPKSPLLEEVPVRAEESLVLP